MLEFLYCPSCTVLDPEVATHFEDEGTLKNPVYLDLGCPQYTQIFRSTFSLASDEAWQKALEDAWNRHTINICTAMEFGTAQMLFNDIPYGTVGEGSDNHNKGIRPVRTMAGVTAFHPYIRKNFRPGVMMLKGRGVIFMKPKWVTHYAISDGTPYELFEGGWLSELALGWIGVGDGREYTGPSIMEAVPRVWK